MQKCLRIQKFLKILKKIFDCVNFRCKPILQIWIPLKKIYNNQTCNHATKK